MQRSDSMSSIRRTRFTVVAVLAAALTLSACENEDDGRRLGQVLGSIGGAVLGSQIGSGAGRIAATRLGSGCAGRVTLSRRQVRRSDVEASEERKQTAVCHDEQRGAIDER